MDLQLQRRRLFETGFKTIPGLDATEKVVQVITWKFLRS